jgi:hypothetical protein
MAPPCLVQFTLAWHKDQLSGALASLAGCNCNSSSRQMEDMQHRGLFRKPRPRLHTTMERRSTTPKVFAYVCQGTITTLKQDRPMFDLARSNSEAADRCAATRLCCNCSLNKQRNCINNCICYRGLAAAYQLP